MPRAQRRDCERDAAPLREWGLHLVQRQSRSFSAERLASLARLCDTCFLCLSTTSNRLHKKLPDS
jgi:hypothetical protein